MQRIIKLYQSAIKYKKVSYGICGLGILGAIMWLTAYNRRSRSIHSSLKAFNPKSELEGTIFNTKDKCSLSNIDEVTTLHTSIKLKIDFQSETLIGTVQLKLKALQDITRVILDMKLLTINQISVNGAKLQYNQRNAVVPELGDQLEILTIQSKGSEFVIEIDYQTQQNKNGEQAALNWLQPPQTFGGKNPFLFTQSEPIYARTLYPCQDTPSVKSTFEIILEVPAPLQAYASGLLRKSETIGQWNVFTFEQPVAIPAYLFAICAGDLVKSQVSERTYVIAEPVFVNKCVQEFQDMESYLQEIENYLTPYKWTEYTAVVLPKAFPFGGMENPNLTFLSPSLIVGDKSETSVVIHEMVHSWSGNSMTCQNWECFWLNEGITTFIENKIVGKVFGEQQQKLHALLGNNALQKAVDSYGANHTYTSLSPKINQSNPDDCFSSIPYMKGFQFLRFLELQIGEVMFQKFIRLVVEQKTLNANQFKTLFENFLVENAINTFDIKWDEWVVEPGMPQFKLGIEDSVKTKYEGFAQQLFENLLEPDVFNRLHSNEQCYVLDLLGQFNIDSGVIRNLDEDYRLFESRNPEILHRVLIYGIKYGYPGALGDHLTQFLKMNGRMKFINPVYRVLAEHQQELGQRIFNMCKSGYHSIAVAQIQKMFQK